MLYRLIYTIFDTVCTHQRLRNEHGERLAGPQLGGAQRAAARDGGGVRREHTEALVAALDGTFEQHAHVFERLEKADVIMPYLHTNSARPLRHLDLVVAGPGVARTEVLLLAVKRHQQLGFERRVVQESVHGGAERRNVARLRLLELVREHESIDLGVESMYVGWDMTG